MKKIIFLLTAFSSLSAFANNPNVFVGKYSVESGYNCDRDGGTRAYVSVEKDIRGVQSVMIQYYSDEAVLMEIPAVSGKVKSPGSPDHYDTNAVTWPNKNTMNVHIKTSGPRANYEMRHSLVLTKKNLSVITLDEAGREDERCELTRQ